MSLRALDNSSNYAGCHERLSTFAKATVDKAAYWPHFLLKVSCRHLLFSHDSSGGCR
jgi:hypothetical protein